MSGHFAPGSLAADASSGKAVACIISRTNEYSDLFSCMHRVMPCARAGAHALPRARRLSRLPHVPWLAIGSGARGDVVVKESHPRVPAITCVVVVVG